VISLPIAFLAASRGGNGWRERSARDAERDAAAMAAQGYRVVSIEERSVPHLGIYWQEVTYELVDGTR
jgi:very-short-patch-repair endonuclease